MSIRQTVSQYWFTFQRELFPWLADILGPLGERHKRFARVLELVLDGELLARGGSGQHRLLVGRATLAQAFLAKAVFDVPMTRGLVERLRTDRTRRSLCA